MRAGSLCAGIGGADLALEALGFDIAWHAEIDPDASTVLAHHWPDVPNIGDIKAADWSSSVEPVDAIVAGYPCQPFSTAGRRGGADDPRHLWPAVRRAVAELRPRYVFLENVRGHLTLGFGAVLADLAALGFDAEWGVLGSDAAGGCHRRHRLWVAAAHPDGVRRASGGGRSRSSGATRVGSPAITFGSSADDVVAADADESRRQGGESTPRRHMPPRGADSADVSLLPTPTAWLGRRPSQGDGDADRWNNPERSRELSDFVAAEFAQDFGRYQAAVDRWAAIFGPPPAPTEPNTKGGRRLHAPFPEWMMGFPAGWVTDHVGRSAALRCIGNAIQPQTAIAAWGELLARIADREAVAA